MVLPETWQVPLDVFAHRCLLPPADPGQTGLGRMIDARHASGTPHMSAWSHELENAFVVIEGYFLLGRIRKRGKRASTTARHRVSVSARNGRERVSRELFWEVERTLPGCPLRATFS